MKVSMRLAEFILANAGPILAEWDVFAHSLAPGKTMTQLALRDDAEAILLATARDMQVGQSLAQQASKSRGHGGADGVQSDRLDDASARHGAERVGSGYDIVEVVSEYRALRATVLRLWRRSLPQPNLSDIDDITRFNESIDQSLAEAVGSYTEHVDKSRRLFLAILSHDLRDPLNCIYMATHLVSRTAADAAADSPLSVIKTTAEATMRLITDLIDFASTGLGLAIPLTRSPVDLEELGRQVVDACRTAHPHRTLHYHPNGDLTGDWDGARLRQVISNLVGNAFRHGSPDGPVEVSIASEGLDAVLSVHNEGVPIAAKKLRTLFDPLARYDTPEAAMRRTAGGLGLGLHIVREIVVAHAGTVEVASTAEEGTTFTVRLPRSHSQTVAE